MIIKRALKEILRQGIKGILKSYLRFRPSPPFERSEIKRVLVYAYTGLGNFVLFTPALRSIREHLPQASFTLLHGDDTGCQEVVRGSDLFDKYIVVKRNAGWWTRVKWICRLRKDRYDLVISEFHNNNAFMILLTVLGGAQHRLGHVTSPGWSNNWDWVYNIPVKMEKDQHEIERYMELAWALGIDENRRVPEAFLHIEKEDRTFAQSFLKSAGFEKGDKLICLHPGTSPAMRWKQWPLEKYKELCERILKVPDTKIIVLGTASERNAADQLFSKQDTRIIDAVGKTTVRQAAALIEMSDLFVGNDSGLAKISIALDTPTITIWGPSDYLRAKAWRPGHDDIRKDMVCSPCSRLDGRDKVGDCSDRYKCLELITVDEVFEVVARRVK